MKNESWVVKNITKGPLYLPQNKIRFHKPNQERDLVFFTGKTIFQLERDPEIHKHLKEKTIETVGEIIRFDNPSVISDDAINKLRKEIENQNIASQIDELKELLKAAKEKENQEPISQPPPPPEPAPTPNIDMSEIIKTIKDNINVTINQQVGEKTSYNENDEEEEKLREEALEKLIFSKKEKITKNFEKLGKEKEIENESSGNEDLLDF